jgi:hypothetical protein
LAIYDQYEVAVPLDRIGDCVETLQRAMNDPRNPLRDGFPIPGLVRYVKSEPFYLSPTNVRLLCVSSACPSVQQFGTVGSPRG